MSEHQDKRVRLDEADKDAEDEIGSNTLTEAEKFLLTLKEHFMWSILTTTDKLHPAPRVVNLHHIPEFGFLITTRSYYSKMEQIAKNPIGTISIYPSTG
ncbi:MAG: hypothetical protein EZS28_043438 [Streblomastix strix]|uniref:Pyridoxamine 5'-phosphate oxidase putative domain-containing protein n=1 Tax=Streblomastix strix TaxID=222440 RepID=A0A5J4TR68_9EUKA|nr:MAG: hypothetical protein EZS28_043438 [Streblomastix strix]